MEYTELADYPLPAGIVTEWTPTADAADWTDDHRKLSYAHLEHAARARDVGDDWYSHWIGTAFTVDHPLDADAMSRTLVRWYARHEAFRSTVTHLDLPGLDGTADDFGRRIIGADAVRIDAVRDASVSSSSAVYQRINEFFNTRITPLQWPHCLAVTVEPDTRDHSFLLVFGADHTVMDAYTQVFAIKELTRLYEAELLGRDDSLATFGSYLDFSHAERAAGAQLDSDAEAVSRWVDFLCSHSESRTQPDPMPAFPRPQDTRPDDLESTIQGEDPAFQASLSTWVLDADQTERFHRACKAHGSNMQAGVYTALSIAADRLAGAGDLRFVSPVHTRTELQWGEAAGWFVGLVPVHLRPGAASTFGTAIGPIAQCAKEYKDLGTVPFHPIAHLIGHRTPPQFVVSYIDLRGAEGADQWNAQNARVLRSASPAADEVYFWINRIPTGTNLSARFPAGRSDADYVHRFLRVFTDVLLEVVRDGDTTFAPSDLATAQAESSTR
ncbi:condensation domain-containing protein [Williamsia sterculiae]|uniref:Condensation domain-containing protein n=1 Tax=Williamsia sterculiae TaxID=1344003 RepID=A0A1N7DZI9_9NOCA|nr:condensation domain-containing protein [Williamsia sterculiae]SIR81233.1 Condensation domain-containing protein [Williamsia sterculiae]